MVKEIKMPDISEDADSGTIVEILVKEGDTIEEEQSIIAVESDKASVEVPSPEGGKVKEIKVSEGDELKVGDVILTLEIGENGEPEEKEATEGEESKAEDKKKEDEKNKDQEQEDQEKEAVAAKEPEVKEKDEKKSRRKEKEDEEKEEGSESDQEEAKSEVPAAPSVRRQARELGVDIRQVKGSGPGGRITAEDVKAQTGEGKKQAKKPQEISLPDFAQWGHIEKEKMSSIRRITAESMADAWQTVPHVTQFDKADISKMEEYSAKYEEKAEKAGGKLTITAILLKVSAAALRAFPKFNASIDPQHEEVIYKKYFHLGVAVDTEKGLLVPVIRDVDKKSVVQLSTELPEIAQKAREGKLSADEMKGGTFTISNLGGIGGTNFTPIVYKPQVAILGVSRTQIEPVYIDGEFQPRSMLPLSLSYDHRLIDGAEAARFLRLVCESLEDPFVMLMEG